MAVGYVGSAESHTGATGSTSEASFSWTSAGGGSPRGVSVAVITIGTTTDKISSVTYGGTAMTRVSGGAAISSDSDENGRCDLFHLGTSIPTGNQTVTVNRTNDATAMYAVSIVQSAGADTEVYTSGIVLLQTTGTLAEQSVSDGSTGVNSMRFAALYSGLAATPAAGANSTSIQTFDIGSQVAMAVRETTAGQGSRSVGFSDATSQDIAAVHWAVREVTGSTLTDVDTDETIYTGQTSVAYTGTGLASADAVTITTDTNCTASATSVSATNSTSGTFTAPSLSAAFTAGIKFGSCTYTIKQGVTTLGTLAGTFNAESAYTVHTVSDISQAADDGTIYYWINLTGTDVAVGDQVIFDNKGGDVTMDSQGFISFANGETSTTYRARDDTDNTWSGSWSTFSVISEVGFSSSLVSDAAQDLVIEAVQ